MQQAENNAPAHVAIIMDGNGRWATERGKMRPVGHRAGVKTVHQIVAASVPLGIQCLTLFAFSSENWQRPAAEVKVLLRLFKSAIERELAELIANQVRVRFLGDVSAFSAGLQKMFADTERQTQNNNRLHLNIAVNYGGRWDIANACQKIASQVASGELAATDITEQMISQNLTTADCPPLDLLIRTGQEKRISNFLLWQMAYAELYFVDTLWPDFSAEDLEMAIEWYKSRQRRFGRVGTQARVDYA